MVGKTAFIMEVWVNSLSTTDNDVGIAANGASGNSNVFVLIMRNGDLSITIDATVYNTGVNIANTGWRHVAATYDGTTAILYLDGICLTEFVAAVTAFSATDRWSIGQEFDGSTSDRFSGTMDEARIWDRALCAAEIQRRLPLDLL